MLHLGWSAKRERRYRHIKESLLDRGRPEAKAEEIAARTVNGEGAQGGETPNARRTLLLALER
jgi:plasmid stabilization system protein ParE